MFWSLFRTGSATVDQRIRKLCIERLEDRRMLATIADVVFIVDESNLEDNNHDWVSRLVAGDPANNVPSLAQQLALQGITDVQYGLVGYGQGTRFAHSHIVGTQGITSFDRLWSSGPSMLDHENQFKDAALTLVADGETEDGWDALDHAFAEYDFRPGAVPVFVMLQSEGARSGQTDPANDTLTRDGILSALRSKNVIVNVMAVKQDASSANGLFDLSPYGLSNDIRILGVEADAADTLSDGAHDYHWFDTNTFNSTTDTPVATTSDALQVSFNGSNTGATGMVGSGKSVLIGENISGGIGVNLALAA